MLDVQAMCDEQAKIRTFDGLCGQEAAQADGEEEAPQTAATYQGPAPQQEVAATQPIVPREGVT
jgi:hypothetical protein